MKLELKHIIPYLLHEIMVKDEEIAQDYGLAGVNIPDDEILIYKETGDIEPYSIELIKPILQSLSGFNDNELVYVKEYIGHGKWCEAYDQYFDIWFDNAPNVHKLVLQAPYEIFQYFLSEHYDVFGLIDNGLAIEI